MLDITVISGDFAPLSQKTERQQKPIQYLILTLAGKYLTLADLPLIWIVGAIQFSPHPPSQRTSSSAAYMSW